MNTLLQWRKDWVSTEYVANHKELWALEVEMCRRDFWYFALRWVKTKDSNFQPTVRDFPFFEYLIKIHEVLLTEKRVAIEKSRRMIMTWFFCARTVWKCLFFPNQAVGLQSKKLMDSKGLLGKTTEDFITHILKRLPPFFYELVGYPNIMVETIAFASGSWIRAIAQGPEQLRQWGLSDWEGDEVSKHDRLEDELGASLPTLEGGGNAFLWSSVRPGDFNELCRDNICGTGPRPLGDPPREKLIWCGNPDHIGLEIQRNPWNRFVVLRLHYSANPLKDPCTPEGKQWLEETKRGMSEAEWAQEYELDASALAATLVIPEFNMDIHVKDFEIPLDTTIYHSLDLGIDAPTAGIWAAVDKTGDVYVFEEYYHKNRTIEVNALEMNEVEKAWSARLNRDMKPYFSTVDPSAFDRMMTGLTPVGEYAKYGRHYGPGGNDLRMGIFMLKHYLTNAVKGLHPAIYFARHLVNTFFEFRNWTFKDDNDTTRKRHDHIMSCLRYLVLAPPVYINKQSEPLYEVRKDWLTGYNRYERIKEEEDYNEVLDLKDYFGGG